MRVVGGLVSGRPRHVFTTRISLSLCLFVPHAVACFVPNVAQAGFVYCFRNGFRSLGFFTSFFRQNCAIRFLLYFLYVTPSTFEQWSR